MPFSILLSYNYYNTVNTSLHQRLNICLYIVFEIKLIHSNIVTHLNIKRSLDEHFYATSDDVALNIAA